MLVAGKSKYKNSDDQVSKSEGFPWTFDNQRFRKYINENNPPNNRHRQSFENVNIYIFRERKYFWKGLEEILLRF